MYLKSKIRWAIMGPVGEERERKEKISSEWFRMHESLPIVPLLFLL